MADVKKSSILTIYERSIFAKIGASVSSLKEQQIPPAEVPKQPKEIDLVKLNSDFMKIVVEPFKTALYLSGVWGNIVVNPSESVIRLFDKANEPTPIVIDKSDRLLRSKMAIPVLSNIVNLLLSPKDEPVQVKKIDLTKSPLAQLVSATNTDLLRSPMDTPDPISNVNLLNSPIDIPNLVKSIDLLKSPIDTPDKIQLIDLLKSPMDTPGVLANIDLLKSPTDTPGKVKIVNLLGSPMDTPGKITTADLLKSPMNTPGVVKSIDLLSSPMKFPVGNVVTEKLLKSSMRPPLPFATTPLLFLYGRFGTSWTTVDFFDREKNYALGFTANSTDEYSEFINDTKALGIIHRGHEPQAILNTPWSKLGAVDYFDIPNQHAFGFTTNAELKDSDFVNSDGIRINTPLLMMGTKAAYEYIPQGGLYINEPDFSFLPREFKYNSSLISTDEKNSELYMFNNKSEPMRIGSFGRSFGVGDSGMIEYGGIMAYGYRAPQYKLFNPDSKPWYWSRIRESSDSGKGMTGILSDQGNIDKFTPVLPDKTSEFKYIDISEATRTLGSKGGSNGVKQAYIANIGIPPQGQSNSSDKLYYWSKARTSSSVGIESEKGNIDKFSPKSPFSDYKKDSDFYALRQNALVRIDKSNGLIAAPVKSLDGKLVLPSTDAENLYKELFGFDLDMRLGVLNQYKNWSGIYSKLSIRNLFKEFVPLQALDVAAIPAGGMLTDSSSPQPNDPSTGQLLSSRLVSFYTPKINSDTILYTPVGFGKYKNFRSSGASRIFGQIVQSGLDLAGVTGDLLLSSLESTAYRLIAGAMGLKGDAVDDALKTSFPLQVLAGPMFAGVKSLPPDTVVSTDTGASLSATRLPDANSVLSQLGGGIPSAKSLTGITQAFGVSSDAVMRQAVNSIQNGVSGLISNVVNSLLGKTLLDAEKVLMIRHILDGTKYTAGQAFYDPNAPWYNSYYSVSPGDYAYNRYAGDKDDSNKSYRLDSSEGKRNVRTSNILPALQDIYNNLSKQSETSKTSILGTQSILGDAKSIQPKNIFNPDIPTAKVLSDRSKSTVNFKSNTEYSKSKVRSKLFQDAGNQPYISDKTSTEVNYSGTDVQGNKNNIAQFSSGNPLRVVSPGMNSGFINDGKPIDGGVIPAKGGYSITEDPQDSYPVIVQQKLAGNENIGKTLENRGFASLQSDFVDVKNAMDLVLHKQSDTFNDFDLIDFYFEDISSRPGDMDKAILIPFRAILTGYNDNTSTTWNEINYAGRPDKFWIYQGFDRKVDISFDVAIESKAELLTTWRKLNYLSGMCYPVNFPQQVAMTGPIIQVTVGNLLQKVPAFLNAFSFSLDNMTIWELEKHFQLPTYIKVIIDMTILYSDIPLASKRHFAQNESWIDPQIYEMDFTDVKNSDDVRKKYRASTAKKVSYKEGKIVVE